MTRPFPLLALTLLATGCLFGGPPSPTLEMQTAAASGPVSVQILDSSVEPDEIYLRLMVHNTEDRPLLVDRRMLVLGDGRTEWPAVPISKSVLTIKPRASSSKIKLTFKGVPAGQPSYNLLFKKGAFRLDNETGKEIALPTTRLLVKKAAVATPEPTPAPAQTPAQR